MTGGEVARLVAAAVVGFGGLWIARRSEVALTTDQLGVLIFAAAALYGITVIGRHFDRRSNSSTGG